jgi:hypothetical protein
MNWLTLHPRLMYAVLVFGLAYIVLCICITHKGYRKFINGAKDVQRKQD